MKATDQFRRWVEDTKANIEQIWLEGRSVAVVKIVDDETRQTDQGQCSLKLDPIVVTLWVRNIDAEASGKEVFLHEMAHVLQAWTYIDRRGHRAGFFYILGMLFVDYLTPWECLDAVQRTRNAYRMAFTAWQGWQDSLSCMLGDGKTDLAIEDEDGGLSVTTRPEAPGWKLKVLVSRARKSIILGGRPERG